MSRSGLRGAGIALAIVACVAASRTATPAETDAAPPSDETRAAVAEWVEIQRAISKEKRDLVLSREALAGRIEVVRREIEEVRARIDEVRADAAEADEAKAALEAEIAALAGATDSLSPVAAEIEARTAALLARFPAPLRERVDPLARRLPVEGEASDAPSGPTVAERFQNAIGILNEANKFAADVATTSEVRSLADGTSAEVATIYLGLGQAYYVGANGTVAGVGTASETGWVWRPFDASAPAIAEAVAILKNEAPARYVRLPILIDDEETTR